MRPFEETIRKAAAVIKATSGGTSTLVMVTLPCADDLTVNNYVSRSRDEQNNCSMTMIKWEREESEGESPLRKVGHK